MDTAAAGEAGAGTPRDAGPAVGLGALARGEKKARRLRAWIAFQDESGISQRPAVRWTWAPRGETPVLIHAFNWHKMSVSAALAYRWDSTRCRVFFQTTPDNYHTEKLIAFLNHLKRERRGQPCLVIWDGVPAHKSTHMTVYLAGQRDWLLVERLPGYAPDLNPVEAVWGNVKGQELANLCAGDRSESAGA